MKTLADGTEAELTIIVRFADETDVDWMRAKLLPLIEEAVEENRSRLDGEVSVDWERE